MMKIRMRKGMAMLVALCMLITMIPMNVFANFVPTDISSNWAKGTIQSWIDQDLINGYPEDNTFKPEQSITRAEFMKLVNGAFGYIAIDPISYTDVKADAWYYTEVCKAEAAGYINGYGDGTMLPENPITREEAAKIISVVNGLPDDVTAISKYSDKTFISSYAEGYVGAVTTAGIMQGYPDGTFIPKGEITRAESVFALDNALDYATPLAVKSVSAINSTVTVTLSSAPTVTPVIGDFAVTNGTTAVVPTAISTTGAVVTLTVPTIAATAADQSIVYSVSYKTATAVAAPAFTVAALAVSSVNAIGVKSVEVKFNAPVDTTKAVLNIKKGAAIYGSTVAWNDAKDTATLTTVVTLPAADYSIVVTGLTDVALTKAFTVSEGVASKVEITSTTIPLVNSATIAFKVSNQYGEDMKVLGNASGVVVSAYNTTQKKTETLTNATPDNKLTFSSDFATTAKLGDVIRVTVAYVGLTAQANVTVGDVASSAIIAFGTIAPLKDTTRISVSDPGLVIPYTMYDQFGVETKLTTHGADADGVSDIETIDGVQFISSKPLTVDVDSFAVDAAGVLTFTAGTTAGTAIITAIINASGAVASFSVTVNAVGLVDSLAISAPAALVAAGEIVKLDLSAADQFGVDIAAKDIAVGDITSSDTNVVPSASATIVAGKLNVDTLAAGTTTISVKNEANTKVVGTVTVVVEAAAKAAQVSSISFAPNFEVGATKILTTSDFVVLDQYGRVIPKADVTFEVVKKVLGETVFTLTGATFTAGATAGSQVFTLTATAYTVTAPTYDFTLNTVASADITSYAITTVPTIYSEVDHAKVLELVGKTAAGQTVVLIDNKVTYATSSDTSKVTVAVDADGIATVTGVVDAEGTAVVALWNGATKLAETTVTLSAVAPVATTVKFNATTETALGATTLLTVNLLDNLEVKDQYGVTIVDSGFWTSSDATKASVVAGVVTTVGTPVPGATVTIGYVSSNGLVATTVLTAA